MEKLPVKTKLLGPLVWTGASGALIYLSSISPTAELSCITGGLAFITGGGAIVQGIFWYFDRKYAREKTVNQKHNPHI